MAEYQTREFHPAFEEYCEAIWELKEDDVEVIQARVAERLHVSRPAVSEMIKRMQSEGFVALDGTTINLTASGRDLAEQVVRRHRLAERLLTDVLGLPWADAHVEAGKWEHVISEPVERAINRVLDNPTTCPHGNPIPGSSYAAPETVPLAKLPVGSTFTVTRIPEELEFTPGLLEFLEEATVQPGRSGTVTATSPDGTTTVEIDGQHVGIGAFASTRILVMVAAAGRGDSDSEAVALSPGVAVGSSRRSRPLAAESPGAERPEEITVAAPEPAQGTAAAV